MARASNNPLGLPRRWLGPRRMCRVKAWGLGQAEDSQSDGACGFPRLQPSTLTLFPSLSPHSLGPEVCPLWPSPSSSYKEKAPYQTSC